MRFEGKVVIVTGASSGIGEATALAFAREGAIVNIADVDRAAGQQLVKRIRESGARAEAHFTDVSREKSVAALMSAVMDSCHALDILVNNAGIYYQANAAETPLEVWNRILAVNLTGAYLCIKHAVPAMRRGRGVVVNVASEAGLVGIRDQVAYNVSKGGLIALSRSCAVDFAADGIRVNCVCPGTTDTPLVKAAVRRSPDPLAARHALEAVRPANRLGRPEEIAEAVLYLASDLAAYATGAVLSIDGGYTAQ